MGIANQQVPTWYRKLLKYVREIHYPIDSLRFLMVQPPAPITATDLAIIAPLRQILALRLELKMALVGVSGYFGSPMRVNAAQSLIFLLT